MLIIIDGAVCPALVQLAQSTLVVSVGTLALWLELPDTGSAEDTGPVMLTS